jgi:hypothetical protein
MAVDTIRQRLTTTTTQKKIHKLADPATFAGITKWLVSPVMASLGVGVDVVSSIDD